MTPVRHAPAEVLGIVNLRGKIVTVVDLGLRLGFPKAVAGGDSRIFIMEDRNEFIGLLVDRVDEVVEVERDAVAAAAGQRELRDRPGSSRAYAAPGAG